MMALTKSEFRALLSKEKPLLLDGANGTALIEKCGNPDPLLWTTAYNFSQPDLVQMQHERYASAGADCITTNTFRSNFLAWQQSGSHMDYTEFVHTSVAPALQVKQKYPQLLIAGSNAPAEDCYKTDRSLSFAVLRENHLRHSEALLEAGVDFLLHETQSHLDEIDLLCGISDSLCAPYALSLYCTESLRLLSGEFVADVLEHLQHYTVDLICFNCISPETFTELLSQIVFPPRWGFYLNCGTGNFSEGTITGCISPDAYSHTVKQALAHKPSLIGGCCGTGAAHIAKIRSLLDAQSLHEITGED